MADATTAAAPRAPFTLPDQTGQAVSDWLGFSPRWLSKLVNQGFAERKENGLFDPAAVAFGYIRFLKDADRRAVKNAPSDELRKLQLQRLRIDIAKTLDGLIETDLAEECAKEMLGTLRAVFLSLEPIPDPAMEAKVKARITAIIEKGEAQFAKFFDDIRAGCPAGLDVDDDE